MAPGKPLTKFSDASSPVGPLLNQMLKLILNLLPMFSSNSSRFQKLSLAYVLGGPNSLVQSPLGPSHEWGVPALSANDQVRLVSAGHDLGYLTSSVLVIRKHCLTTEVVVGKTYSSTGSRTRRGDGGRVPRPVNRHIAFRTHIVASQREPLASGLCIWRREG